MDNKVMEKVVCKLFRLLDFPSINVDSFDDRLRYQKVIYLLQYYDLPVGFRFNWYVRGPYSPPLTDILYSIRNQPDLWEQCSDITFVNQDEVEKTILDFKGKLGEKIDDWQYLEIFASLSYIKESNPPMDDESLIGTLVTLKPFIEDFSNFQEKCRDILIKLKPAS